MKLKLSACNNEDFYDDNRKIKPFYVRVESLKEAVEVCQKFISEHFLGGGNWNGGQVYDDKDVQIAQVSYNGRVWNPGKWPQPEIILD